MSGERTATQPKILHPCHEVAERENMVWVCDGAANVGQIGHEVEVLLTNMGKARMLHNSCRRKLETASRHSWQS